MGGHGAFICAFRNPGKYKSVSALAPVCDSAKCRPSQEAFKLYFGGEPNDSTWEEWNATALVKKYNGPPLQILIDQVRIAYFSLLCVRNLFRNQTEKLTNQVSTS